MAALRLVSIAHPTLGGIVGANRFGLLPDTEVTMLVPHEPAATPEFTGTVRRVSMPATGKRGGDRFPALAAALDWLKPDVVHLQADPDSRLASQVARLCGRLGRGLVLETEMSAAETPPSWPSALRARNTLRRTDAVVSRSVGALSLLRRLGFDGLGVVAGRGLEAQEQRDVEGARRRLHIDPGPAPVIGWFGPLDRRSPLTDMLEAVALCRRNILLLIPAGADHQDMLDRADALEILHRVRFVAPDHPHAVTRGPVDLAAFPTMVAAVDALAVAPAQRMPDRACAFRAVELAQTHAIPVIHAGLPELADPVGAGGWQVPFSDAPLLARLFDELHVRPDLLQQAAAACARALTRHSPEAAAAELARAIAAAARAGVARTGRHTGRRTLELTFGRQPGST